MKVEQSVYRSSQECKWIKEENLGKIAQIVFVFAAKKLLLDREIFLQIREKYPAASLIGCTTAGEIFASEVAEDTLTVTAVYFEQTPVKFASTQLSGTEDCYAAAVRLVKSIPHENLAHILVISEGININGSMLVKGFVDNLPQEVTVTGGLSADGKLYQETFVLDNDYVKSNKISIIAFYGSHIKISFASCGGWDSFGIERVITKSHNNVLYKFDDKPALDLYKEYLGESAKKLPYSALFFPINIRSHDHKYSHVRTVSAVNEKEKSLTFAGDVPEGYLAKLMKANFNNLILGSQKAAEDSARDLGQEAQLALLISCIGRKLVLGQMVEEEIEVVREVLGEKTIFTGFYSYGEIAPREKETICEFHNQTMTITLFSEE